VSPPIELQPDTDRPAHSIGAPAAIAVPYGKTTSKTVITTYMFVSASYNDGK
jgi:hypothetical protein